MTLVVWYLSSNHTLLLIAWYCMMYTHTLHDHGAQQCVMIIPLHWRHNARDSVSNHQPNECLLNCLFRRRSKKTSKLRVTGLCAGNSPGTGEFPAQMVSNAENISIWWRHHASGVHHAHDNVIKWKHFCVTGWFPSQRPWMQSFDVFFDLRLNRW